MKGSIGCFRRMGAVTGTVYQCISRLVKGLASANDEANHMAKVPSYSFKYELLTCKGK